METHLNNRVSRTLAASKNSFIIWFVHFLAQQSRYVLVNARPPYLFVHLQIIFGIRNLHVEWKSDWPSKLTATYHI